VSTKLTGPTASGVADVLLTVPDGTDSAGGSLGDPFSTWRADDLHARRLLHPTSVLPRAVFGDRAADLENEPADVAGDPGEAESGFGDL